MQEPGATRGAAATARRPRSRLRRALVGSHGVPAVPWTSPRPWCPRPPTLFVLVLGLAAFGLGEALLIRSRLGNSPWAVLAQGISLRTGVGIGWTTVGLSAIVLAMWVPLRQRPGLGTVMNVIVIASVLQLSVDAIAPATEPLARAGFVAAGVVSIGCGSALYLTCGLGPGPRDGWMTALHRRSGWPVARVRLCIEATVASCGALLGGSLGIGTVLFALTIGRSLAFFLGVVERATSLGEGRRFSGGGLRGLGAPPR